MNFNLINGHLTACHRIYLLFENMSYLNNLQVSSSSGVMQSLLTIIGLLDDVSFMRYQQASCSRAVEPRRHLKRRGVLVFSSRANVKIWQNEKLL